LVGTSTLSGNMRTMPENSVARSENDLQEARLHVAHRTNSCQEWETSWQRIVRSSAPRASDTATHARGCCRASRHGCQASGTLALRGQCEVGSNTSRMNCD
jgi:hypothetical protein